MLVHLGVLAVLCYGECQSLHYLLRTEKRAVFKVKVESLSAFNWVNISLNMGGIRQLSLHRYNSHDTSREVT